MMINQGKMYGHNKTWSEYESGYTLDNYNVHYWMGLKAMKKINDGGHKTVYLETTFIYPYGNTTYLQYRYDDFTLDTASNGYKFTFSQSTPTKYGTYSDNVQHSDCLGGLKGARFSTWDINNDGDSGKNCAAESGVGWWYNGCNMVCNPLGLSSQYFSWVAPKQLLNMAGLNYANGMYVNQIAATMYFMVDLK